MTLPCPFSGSAIQKLTVSSMPSGREGRICTLGAGLSTTRGTAATAASQHRLELAHVGAVGDRHRRLHQHARIGERRVLDPGGDQRLVGDDRLAPVERADHRVAGADVGDPALEVVDLDHVADAHAALGEDDEAADVVGGDLLQAEAEADADRAAEHRQRGQVDADRREREHQADEQQHRAHQGRGDLAQREVLAAGVREQLPLEHRRDPEREHEHDARGDRALDEVAQADLRRADLPLHLVHRVEHRSASTSVTQSTTTIQAIHEMLRSTMRTQGTAGKVRVSTRTMRRMTTSESRIGIASLEHRRLDHGLEAEARRERERQARGPGTARRR